MAFFTVVSVGYNPELTPETAMEVFRRHFDGRYRVIKVRAMVSYYQFIVQKTWFTGVLVGLRQKEGSTSFTIKGWYGSQSAIGLISWLWLRSGWKKMEDEVKSFIENAPEFKEGSSQHAALGFCSRCGVPLTAGGRFCTKCGASVG